MRRVSMYETWEIRSRPTIVIVDDVAWSVPHTFEELCYMVDHGMKLYEDIPACGDKYMEALLAEMVWDIGERADEQPSALTETAYKARERLIMIRDKTVCYAVKQGREGILRNSGGAPSKMESLDESTESLVGDITVYQQGTVSDASAGFVQIATGLFVEVAKSLGESKIFLAVDDWDTTVYVNGKVGALAVNVQWARPNVSSAYILKSTNVSFRSNARVESFDLMWEGLATVTEIMAKVRGTILESMEVLQEAKGSTDPAIRAFMDALGIDPDTGKTKTFTAPRYVCPKCESRTAVVKERHPDTSYNEILGVCNDCGYEGQPEEFEKIKAGV
ncbi:MAG: hypothetical protein GY869_04710 [Planctomycetes bacterium]|nr:hypothetical protein [Planctomycetota bacterium]